VSVLVTPGLFLFSVVSVLCTLVLRLVFHVRVGVGVGIVRLTSSQFSFRDVSPTSRSLPFWGFLFIFLAPSALDLLACQTLDRFHSPLRLQTSIRGQTQIAIPDTRARAIPISTQPRSIIDVNCYPTTLSTFLRSPNAGVVLLVRLAEMR